MRRSSASALALLAFLLALPTRGAEPTRTVRVAAFEYYPGVFQQPDGKFAGIYVDLLAAIAEREGWNVEYVHGSWAEGLERIRSGEVDVLTSVAKTAERERFLDYGTHPLLTVWGQVYVPAGTSLDSILELRGKRVALMESDFNGAAFRELARSFGLDCTYVELPDFPAVFHAVQNQEVDAGVVNSTFGSARYDEFRLKETGIVFNPFPIYLAVRKGAQGEVLATLDRYLGAWLPDPDSPYHQARRRWSHGTASAVKVVPRWLQRLLWASLAAVLAAAAFIVLLRRRVRKATAESSARAERLRAIFEAARDIAFLVGDARHTLVEFSPGAERMLGWARSEVVGKLSCDRFFPTSQPGASPLCASPTTRGEVEMLRKDGTRFPAHVTTYRLSDGRGGTGFLGVCFDLSERKALEAELLQSQKMESIGRLAGGVAHDFNNMVQAILGYTDLALASVPSGQLHEDILEIREAARRSAELTRQLLAFARRQPTAPRALSLNEAISQLRRLAERLLGEHLELVWKPADGLWTVYVDPTQVDQVLVNLLVNARDAMGPSGAITVRTFNQAVDAAFCIPRPDSAPGEYAVLEVADTGHGMDEQTVRRIFEPFFTTKGLGQGTGLGLATVYGVVKQNGGFITVDSKPGQGTTFRLFFPRHRGESDAPQPAPPAPGTARGTETVLVVEDERQILELARRTLEGQGYRVLTAGTPAGALESMASHAGPVHLLLTDVVMPEMNGPDLWQKLKDAHPGLRCVFMSGYSEDAARGRLAADPGVPFLHKPFAVKDLAALVRRTLDAPPPSISTNANAR